MAAHLLGAEALHLEFPTKVVFDSVTIGINEGDRIGIVGRNGDGKSSLLAMLAGRLEPDAGRVTVRGGVRIGVLEQADTLDDSLTIAKAVVGERAEHEWAGDPKVRDVIAGLLSDLDWNAAIAPLSGGQRRRVDLARLLVGDDDVLHKVEWRIAPGERTGILGVNGSGKSTLLGLVSGTVEPSSGRVKRGKTVKISILSQQMHELDQYLGDPVRTVIAGLRTTYTFGTGSKAQELSPGKLLERLGFSSAQLSTPVKDLSGGQKRRLQLLLVLLDQPNVLILDEPSNQKPHMDDRTVQVYRPIRGNGGCARVRRRHRTPYLGRRASAVVC